MQKVLFDQLPEIVQELTTKVDKVFNLLTKEQPKPSTPKERILTTVEAAKFLSITKATLYSYTSKGIIASCKRGKHLYFLESDLLQFVKDGRQKTVAEIEAKANAYLSKSKNKREVSL